MASRLSPVTSLLPGVYNACQYGADPKGVNDSTLAIQLALNTAYLATGGAVYLPTGTYLITTLLYFPGSNVSLYGDGMGRTILYAYNGVSFPAGLLVGSASYSFNDVRFLTIDCNGSRGTTFSSSSAVLLPSSNSTLDGVEIRNKLGTVAAGGAGGSIISGSTTIFIYGQAVTIKGCWLHDDFCWQTAIPGGTPLSASSTTGYGQGQTATVASTANFAYTSGASGNQTVIIDPPVNAYLQAAVAGNAGSVAVTPLVDKENSNAGAGLHSGMLGIIPGHQLVIDDANTDKVASITVTAGSGYTNGTYTLTSANGGISNSGSGGSGFSAQVTVSANQISAAVVLDPGVGYASAPTLSLASLGAGSGGALTAVLGSCQETVVVASTTSSTFTAPFTKPHHANASVVYTPATVAAGVTAVAAVTSTTGGQSVFVGLPNTETCQLAGIGPGSTITLNTQIPHPSNTKNSNGDTCIVAYAQTYDAIAAVGQSQNARYIEDINIFNCRFDRLGEDPAGLAEGRRWNVHHNFVSRCPSGIAITDGTECHITNNTVDLSYFGIMPQKLGGSISNTVNGSTCTNPNVGQIWSPVFIVAGTPYVGAYPGSNGGTGWNHIHIEGNTFIGGGYGACLAAATNPLQQLIVANNAFDRNGTVGIYMQDVQGCTISGNTFTNPNYYRWQSFAGLGMAAILVSANSVSTACDTVAISGNTFLDTTGNTYRMQAAVYLYGINATNINISGNTFKGMSGAAVQQFGLTSSTVANPARATNNKGFNPRGAIDTSVNTNAWCSGNTGMANGNGKPTSGTSYVNMSMVDIMLYLNTVGGITALTIDGVSPLASFAVGQGVLWPAGSTLIATWATTQPIFTAYGN